MDERFVATPVGKTRLDWYAAQGAQRATVVPGHGTATGVEAADLQALARALPPLAIEVVLVTQPYRPAELLATGKPTLVVQGGSDPFGRPDEFPKLPPEIELVEIPAANHMFSTGRSNQGPGPLAQLTDAVLEWLERRLPLIER